MLSNKSQFCAKVCESLSKESTIKQNYPSKAGIWKDQLTIVYCTYSKNHNALNGYFNADWAGDVNNLKFTSGYLFMVGWATMSLRQTFVVYVALAGAMQEAGWMR